MLSFEALSDAHNTPRSIMVVIGCGQNVGKPATSEEREPLHPSVYKGFLAKSAVPLEGVEN
jgi:hypothetical protein